MTAEEVSVLEDLRLCLADPVIDEIRGMKNRPGWVKAALYWP